MFHTSEAFELLPAEQRSAARSRLLEHVTKIAELDGSFLDSHEIGKSYGTSMALLTLANLLEPRRP